MRATLNGGARRTKRIAHSMQVGTERSTEIEG